MLIQNAVITKTKIIEGQTSKVKTGTKKNVLQVTVNEGHPMIALKETETFPGRPHMVKHPISSTVCEIVTQASDKSLIVKTSTSYYTIEQKN